MALNSELLTIIVCPNCRGEVDYDEPGRVVECRECHYRYPVRDDIPVLLIDEAEKPASVAETPDPAAGEQPAASTDTADPDPDPDTGTETTPAGE